MQNKRFIFSPLLECGEIDIRCFRRVASPFEIGARSHILIKEATHREEEGIALSATRIVETLTLISRAVTRKSCLLQGHPTAIGSTRPLVRIVCLAVAVALHGAEVLEERVRPSVPGRGLGTTERGYQLPLPLVVVIEVGRVYGASLTIRPCPHEETATLARLPVIVHEALPA